MQVIVAANKNICSHPLPYGTLLERVLDISLAHLKRNYHRVNITEHEFDSRHTRKQVLSLRLDN